MRLYRKKYEIRKRNNYENNDDNLFMNGMAQHDISCGKPPLPGTRRVCKYKNRENPGIKFLIIAKGRKAE